ncbi:hypothetical protein SAMCFNEI73_pC0544 (plasmid) [Sinorhizobium americanum]|uniref:Uncharacterized protein n=1 Tax=Sinorhizobium americanum TaxID=194963 RepID=A0A1L3LVY8_9HYPH|nr:hypothetical protein SAMCFNEI73_pC0544 [Sinorhizobium americanum]
MSKGARRCRRRVPPPCGEGLGRGLSQRFNMLRRREGSISTITRTP